MSPSLVFDEHRPTLSEVLGRRLGPRGARAALAAAGVVTLAVALALLLGTGDGEIEYVQRGAPEFNFRYTSELKRASPRGEEIVRVERRRPDGLFLQSFAVEPLRLPPYRGELSGFLPLYADREIRALPDRFRDFELVQEGKTRLNEVSGYTVAFRARLGERRLFGRLILLPEPVPGARRGVRLVLLGTPSAGVGKAEDVGLRGVVKRPYRTFRFGTEGP